MKFTSKKLLILLILVMVSVVGCQSAASIPDGYYGYDKKKINQTIDGLSFNPGVPGYLPMEVDFFISDRYTDIETEQEALDVSFYTSDNDMLSIQVVNAAVKQSTVQSETVAINEELDGEYVSNSYAQMLYWVDNGISYKMTYRPSTVTDNATIQGSHHQVSKQELVKVANSFQS
ncbi:hypothetical protein [Radiobacillus sp. PE A8.2]|uniref:hypothetical protein n=1 Tax=Radiobacillus sp. PE A8.2 TaxID=3380349 RepID=UPI0038909B0A